MTLVEISVGKLKPWPKLNPRLSFPKEDLTELAASMKGHGVLEPLLVHEANGDGPWIVAGERRWRAAQLANLKAVPCLVREFTELEALEAALIENLHRSDLTAIEEARGLQKYLEVTGISQRELAEKIGRSQPYIANRIRLLDLPDNVLKVIEAGTIEASWARDYFLPFVKIPEKKREKLWAAVIQRLKSAKHHDAESVEHAIGQEAARLSRANAGQYSGATTRCFDEKVVERGQQQDQGAEEEGARPDRKRRSSTRPPSSAAGKPVDHNALARAVGWDKIQYLDGHEPLDPEHLPADKLVRVSGFGKDLRIACIDKAASSKAKASGREELARRISERVKEVNQEVLGIARRRTFGVKVVRTVLSNADLWGFDEDLAAVATSLLGLTLEERKPAVPQLKDSDLELALKILAVQKEQGFEREDVERKVRQQLDTEYRRKVKAAPGRREEEAGEEGQRLDERLLLDLSVLGGLVTVVVARYWKAGAQSARSLVHRFTPPSEIASCGAIPPERADLIAETERPNPPRRCRKCRWENGGPKTRPRVGEGAAVEVPTPSEQAGLRDVPGAEVPGPPPPAADVAEISEQLVETMAEGERVEATLAPGPYPGLPFDRYARIPAASNTALGWLKQSPAHLKAYMENPPTFIDPTSIGRGLHCLLFDGLEAFDLIYQAGPTDDKRLKAWKAWEPTLEPGQIPMRPSDRATVLAMRERLMDHPAARLVLESTTQHELTVVWIDPETELLCKGRPDGIAPELATVVDLKSAENASERAFSRSIYNYGYYRQGAMYRRGARAWLPEIAWEAHVIIAQEKEPPYAVAVYQVQGDALLAGDDEIDSLLRRYKVCVERNEWPGYDDRFVEISLPAWAWTQLEKESRERG